MVAGDAAVTRLKPGRKQVFTRDQAIAAALAEGVGSFTLRAVAARLGVRPSALYREFGSREDLQIAAMAQIARDFLTDSQWATWQDGLRHMVDTQWRMLTLHPEAANVIITQPEACAVAMPHFAALVDKLVDLGIPGGRDAATFALDFAGDTTMMTFVSMQPYVTVDAEGRTGLERATSHMGDAPDVFDMAGMGERGFLDRKIAFIIAGLEAGLLPPATPGA
ncbi:MAG: helix-turn-helix domain-containing protein [Actinomycetaceae bacterium]|nr:helix-turn-helix domain-containing protein [Actinomycetaceae bacterium]MDU0971118.1 helix-turn-helix domain-containing protein [Actinomycetaceae bacterium]